jgi:hypothetical protein
VPDYMRGTIYERVQISNTEPFVVGGYSIVVNLHNTGENTAPTAIREYVKKLMLVHGFESVTLGTYARLSPEMILRDKRVAIVTVRGLIPVGAHAGQRFDILVEALPRSGTTSLAHGEVYQTDLSERGLSDPTAIDADVLATVRGGELFVNPAYALTDTPAAKKASLRVATVLDGGVVSKDRPIFLQLREPQYSTARLIEGVIQHRWQSNTVAAAQNEAVVETYVPPEYGKDWQHFLGVMSHLYINNSLGFLLARAKELNVAAHEPGALLGDISYCWEGMGLDALPVYAPLMTDPDPKIAFAAARAAAFVGDPSAKEALLGIAHDSANPNQLAAVQTLGALPDSPEITHMLRTLLNSPSADVREEAYRILAAAGDDSILSKKIGDRFFLDIVESSGEPLVYATRTGIPRLAIFGHHLSLNTPITFLTMDSSMMISSSDGTNLLTMFYRDPFRRSPINVLSHNDLAEIVARLGGEGPSDDEAFDFSFNDVVAITKQLCDQKYVNGTDIRGRQQLAASFDLEHPAVDATTLTNIARETPAGRPVSHVVDAPAGPASRPSASADPAPIPLGEN